MTISYDYIIIGAGPSGCVLANRLSENPQCHILLIEAGKKDTHPLIHMPVGFAKMTDGPQTWGFKTVPQKHANNREIPYAQGRILGGGSSINAEVFTRGHPSDYNRWANEEDADGWSFADIQPLFIRSEGNSILADDWHGSDGPLGVSNLNPQMMTRAFVQAGQQMGINYNPDFNGNLQAGIGVYQTTIRHGKRCSAAVAYLHPVLHRPNLTLKTDGFVEKIIFDGNRAVGVRINGEVIHADSEILVCSGAIGTPKLMMLSGVGNGDHLKQHDIDVVMDLKGVGENLNDHFGIDIVAELTDHYSLDKYNKPHWALWAGIQYVMNKTGPIASNVVEGGAFWHSHADNKDSDSAVPDLQFHFLAGAGAEAGVPSVPKGSSGITLNSYTLRPKSRGTVRLRSNNPHDLPLIDPNFLGHEDDIKISAEGVRISKEIFEQPALQKYIKKIHFPDENIKTQQDFENYARQYGRTSYHPTCTCKMGKDNMAVVAPDLKVHGLENIRICDSSIMPSVVGSNTNAATIMIGEKASDMIRGNK